MQQFEAEGAGERRGFDKLDRHNIAQPVHLTSARADQRVARVVMTEIVVAEHGGRDKSIGAGVVELR